MKVKATKYAIEEINGKLTCPICGVAAKNLQLHFQRKIECGDKIDLNHFTPIHEEITKHRRDTKNNEKTKKYQKKVKDENPEAFNTKANAANKKSQKKAQDENPEAFKDRNKENVHNCRKIKCQKVDQKERLRNFNKAVLFGPIFICSSCSRKLYENGVVKITEDFKAKVDEKKQGFYRTCIPEKQEVLINIVVNGNDDKSGYYICYTCKSAVISGKVPSMSVTNGLQLTTIEEGCHLTELENNLIAQNINFQYIFCLKKS